MKAKSKKIQKIKFLFFAKLQATMMAIVGFILGVIYSFGGLIVDILVSAEILVSSETQGLGYGTVLAFGALIIMPILFGVFGFLFGFLEVVLYNLFIKWYGKI